ncbi:hypothetical protein SAMN02745121_05943 [Nannocystis exedens]|uniref:Uncharacterized protein n=1 Tax=Nannocystis exedens TaxID=54 RepID=A0A1I2E9P2_9BACT|nr:hypothetical protein [Nannocystis exedens]PCC74878.1 hypothetical protein NAEX_07978 [Nannocystis exedens]SFE89379.1 hypothetical protein SAMN02745121_05943 [Nannocystis exedens]
MRRPLLLLALACLSACKTTTTGRAKAPAATESGAFGTPIAGADDSPLDPTTTSSGAFANPGGPRAGRDGRTEDPERIADLKAQGSAAAPPGPPGSSKDRPLPTCGTTGSYVAVADAECEDGTRPFDGDIPSGMRARRGNVGANKDGHVIDLYEVPCPEGPRKIFVDMYACDRAQPSRSEFERDTYVRDAFLVGDHARFSERCFAEQARGPDRVSLMLQTCLPAMPTALREQGKVAEAHAWLSRYCGGTPPPTADEPKRWVYFRNVLEALDALRVQQNRAESDRAWERKNVAAEYAKVCDVDLKAFERWLKDNPE